MSSLPEYREDAEVSCPTCQGIGRVKAERACATCDGSGSCPHRPLDQAWLRVVEAVMSGDLHGAYAALDQIRDGAFLGPHDQPDMKNVEPGEEPELDTAAVLEAVESLLRDHTSRDT